jgi:hypothetical protein
LLTPAFFRAQASHVTLAIKRHEVQKDKAFGRHDHWRSLLADAIRFNSRASQLI